MNRAAFCVVAPFAAKYAHRPNADTAPVIDVQVNKYCDNLPLYWQEQIFAQRHKINLPRQTLAPWMEPAADRLKPITNTSARSNGRRLRARWTKRRSTFWGNGKIKQGSLDRQLTGSDVFLSLGYQPCDGVLG
jgi:hypothetical protein